MIALILAVIVAAVILLLVVVTIAGILEAKEMEWQSRQVTGEEKHDELETILGTGDRDRQ